ncbi:MAG: 4Fe-4S dicluster domain-containing protein [bacterium]|nr:4Fe-4S dicluster domain-containing protein [bacterium]
MTKRISCIYFSPTGTTKKIVENIAKSTGIDEIRMIDITLPENREVNLPDFSHDLVIVGAPVYYGRLPELVVPVFKSMKGNNNTAAVPVVVYGNREYDDALKELCDIAEACGFKLLASGAFIGEHSYSIQGREIAHGRPDSDDIEKTKEFGTIISSISQISNIPVPGNYPYMEPANLNLIKKLRKETPMTLTPETDMDLCTSCQKCISVCPTAAIDTENCKNIDKFKCIICFACIKSCPTGAKKITDPNFNIPVEQLKEACKERKEPEFFA